MTICFRVMPRGEPAAAPRKDTVCLIVDNWDDFSFKTSFDVVYFSADNTKSEIGTVKIGYPNQVFGQTKDHMERTFDRLPAGWFSLGQDVEYYRNLYDKLTAESRDNLLVGLGDVVANEALFATAVTEPVFKTSLLRSVSMSVIRGQFRRVLNGQPALTKFWFKYASVGSDQAAGFELDFRVEPESKPSTNVHVLIGRNGVGKTTLLNNMVVSVSQPHAASSAFSEKVEYDDPIPLSATYFSSVVSVSFSAFDPFVPPPDQPDQNLGVKYFYVGMKTARSNVAGSPRPPKAEIELAEDFEQSLRACFAQAEKKRRWLAAITRLQSDGNFEAMNLRQLVDLSANEALVKARHLFGRMSSGHSIVLLTITKLVDTVEEKTLVLMDEPESHLHPPLLSAFTRALSDLLHNRNGVAIIATHSPVVVQEVPRSCVWKLSRLGAAGRSDRPERETFGENVGALTREIFGLEVSKSGFYDVLQSAVDAGGTFESVLLEYNDQLGFEAQAVLRTLLAVRDSSTADKSSTK